METKISTEELSYVDFINKLLEKEKDLQKDSQHGYKVTGFVMGNRTMLHIEVTSTNVIMHLDRKDEILNNMEEITFNLSSDDIEDLGYASLEVKRIIRQCWRCGLTVVLMEELKRYHQMFSYFGHRPYETFKG
jgi:hypothetical protein